LPSRALLGQGNMDHRSGPLGSIELVEPIRRQLGISDRVLDVLVTEEPLD
jgi:hypothetical protein